MQSHLLLLSALAALASSATIQRRNEPAWPSPVRDFFAAVGKEFRAVRSSRTAPVCDFESASLPTTSAIPLPPPSNGLVVYHIAVGRGTQNYTCANDSSAAPIAVGANATLFNASCLAGGRPNVLTQIPPAALLFPTPSSSNTPLFPGNLHISGQHYFPDVKTPTFNLHTPAANYGIFFAKRVANTSAPDTAAKGPDGSAAVPWLKLEVLPSPDGGLEADTRDGVREIYRVNTAGGSAPKTCEGRKGDFQVQYAAEYWFFAEKSQ